MVTSRTHAISLLAVLIISSTLLVTLLIALGVFDPVPEGELLWQMQPITLQVPAESSEIRWLNEELPQGPLTIQLTARLESGEVDSAYGLLLDHDDGAVAVLVSPLGYTAVARQADNNDLESADFPFPWQTWPHVRTGDQANEITVVLDGGTMTVRVNREWLWEAANVENVGRLGIIGESFGEEAMIDFQSTGISAIGGSR